MTRRFMLGTRGSPLALVQARLVRTALVDALDLPRTAVEVVAFGSRGDADRSRTIEDLGGRGVFTDELDRAVADGLVDAAVHSAKDLPVQLDAGLRIAATLPREDPREAFVSARHARLADVPETGVFGTASVRRAALLKALRPQARFELLRGNVDERVAALHARPLDGTILAVAGLKRLGLAAHVRETLDPAALMPDPGQGAIAIVARADDAPLRLALARINHGPTLQAVIAERAVLAVAGPHLIVGALAQVHDGQLVVRAVGADVGGHVLARERVAGPARAAEALGGEIGARLLAHTARARRA
jgi:hydroxymethylbilane synthase